MPSDQVLLTEHIDSVCVLTLNRPDKLNSFSMELLQALNVALSRALDDDGTRAIVITGAGPKAFAAGNDITRLASMDNMQAYRDMVTGQRLLLQLHESPKPTIAMVNGYALGGGFELALACDFIVASSNAMFGFPEIGLNTMPGWGGTQLAVLKLGLTKAKEMVLSGARYPVDECHRLGLVSRVCTPETLRAETLSFAAQFTKHHPFAVAMSKRALSRASELPLAAGLDFEAASYAANFATPHARASLNAFIHRKK